MKIITIGREFGSGGRELGKRLADALGLPCYDKEVLHEVAKLHGTTPEYVERITESDIRLVYSSTIARTLSSPVYYNTGAIDLLASQQEVIRRLASEGDCVFVGRSSDVILSDLDPLKIFVYASREAKLERCLAHIRDGETEKSILKQMQKIDRDRAANRRIIADGEWGKKESYHLMVNTTGREVKSLIPPLAEYVKIWFDQRDAGKSEEDQ